MPMESGEGLGSYPNSAPAVAFQFVVKRDAVDAEDLGGSALIVPALLEDTEDVQALDVIQGSGAARSGDLIT